MELKSFFHFFILCLLVINSNIANAKNSECASVLPIYWIGGTGDWQDPNHWSKTSGGSSIGAIPTEDFNAIFDSNSGLTAASTVTISPGEYPVNDFLVFATAAFTLEFDGSVGNVASMNIFGDLLLTSTMTVTYNSPSLFHNEWTFIESNEHDITTNGQDLLHVKFLDQNGIYNQMDDLTASLRIQHYGGEWNSNNHDVNTEFLYFKDENSSSNPLPKVFNAGSSNIYCDEWYSRLTYGSLTVTGSYIIYTDKFDGSPSNGVTNFLFHEIHLLEYPDLPSGGSSIVEHNNFVCPSCIVDKIVIEDTGLTKFHGKFTVQVSFEVTNTESTIAFNGGNGYADEVVFNGNVIVPNIQGCDDRTIFTNIHNDFTTMIRSAGTLNIENSILNNIQAQGSANFQVSNSVLTGSTSGWTENNPPVPLTYVWIGSGTIADWNDPTKWELDNGSNNGCIPKIVDHVFVNSQATSDINIPAGYTAECKNFIWKNTAGRELKLNGTISSKSALKVAGDFGTHASAIITPINSHDIIFVANAPVDITTNNVQLPDIRFESANGEWHLKNKLNADEILFESGTLVTESNDIETDYWVSSGTKPKTFYFEDSHILVNGEFNLSLYSYTNVTVNPGNSLYECEKLTSTVPNMYNLKLNNASTLTLSNYPYVMNDLILNTGNLVRTSNDVELHNLIFNVNDSKLDIDPNKDFTINGGIISNASAANPGELHSKTLNTSADITKQQGNLCVTGYLSLQDINANLAGTFHAPKGIDDGNNSNINFDDGSTSQVLYWIAGSGNWSEVSNWARVSGGCPSNKNPDDSFQLMFDNNGIFPNARTVTVDGGHIANDITIKNVNNALIVVQTSLTVNNLLVDGGYATLQNKNMVVNNTATIQNGGFLVVDLIKLIVDTYSGLAGLMIIKQGSRMEIIE